MMLEVKNINYKYKSKNALKNITFNVGAGIVALLGPNGAGKTTLSKILATQFKIQSGEINLNGKSYRDLKDIRKLLGYMPQDFKAYPKLTGKEFLKFISEIKGNKDSLDIDEIIESIELKNYIDDRISTYSGGMKQKLGIGQALVGGSKVIILDEPTVGLDPQQRNIVRNILSKIAKDRLILITTHIIEDVEYYCDNIVVIDTEILFSGKREEFVNIVNNMVWEVYIDSADNMNEVLRDINIISRKQEGNGIKIRYIASEKVIENSVNVKANIEDAYLYILGNKGR